MSRPIAYNASGPLSGSIRGGNVNYTVDSGNRDYTTFASKKWVPSADGAAPIVFVTDTYTQGFEGNPSLAVPLFYSCNGTGSAAIIYTANRIPGSPGNYSDANVALNDLISARGYFILESNDPYQGDDADSLAFDVDASKMSSYPQTGTNWRDLSGNGNTGVLTNGPTWDSKGWFDFDGTDDKVMIPYSPSLQPTTALTMEAWVYLDVVPSPWYSVFQSPEQNGAHVPDYFDWAIYINADLGLHTRINGIPAPSGTSTTTKMQVQRWTQTAISWEAGIVYFYLNGQLIQTQGGMPTSITYTNNTDKIIGSNAGGFEYVNGQISNVKLYSKRLLDSEVKQNYFGAPIVTDGLVFAVDANNIVSYPKSGTSWYNLTGSVASAILTNGPIFNNINGGAINFDGVDDYAVTSNFPSLSNWSTEIWLNPNVYTTAQKVILDVNLGIRFEIINGYFNSHFGDGSGWIYTNLPSTTQIAANTWFHVVVTVQSGGQARVYVNGILENSINIGSGTTPNVPLYIARFTGATSYEFDGKIANTRIYNRALTPSEVQQNYQAEQYRFETPAGIPTSGLQLWLDAGNLDSYPGTGTTWYDLSSQSNNMTLVNGPTYNQTNGGVIIFDGIDDYAQRTLSNCSTSFKTMTEYTVVSVFQSLDPTTDWNCLYSFGDTSPGNIDNWQQTGTRYFGSDNQSLYTNVDLYTAGINMWAQTFTSGDNKIYRNNTLNTSNAAPTIANPSVPGGFIIANRPEDFGYPTKMNMNLMLIYNRVLTTAELTQIYNYYKGRFGI
jgi:hypothetical protein